ncbi:MAG: hypothetical protein WBP72_14500 [Rhodocyclaceae bacterium]
MITPGYASTGVNRSQQPAAKADRWLVGLLAGAALVYLVGKALDLGRQRSPSRAASTQD